MQTPEEIASEQEKLYESASLRDDLNDTEAKVLLEWGQTQVERVAQMFPDDFEKKTRFLRQLIKNINRFVGQREFNDMDGQRKYMTDVVKYLEQLGYPSDAKNLFAALPDDAKDMMANLKAILMTLTPKLETNIPETPAEPTPAEAQAVSNPLAAPSADEAPSTATEASSTDGDYTSTYSPNTDKTEVIPDIRQIMDYDDESKSQYSPNTETTEVIPNIRDIVDDVEIEHYESTSENSNMPSINQADSKDETGENTVHDEKE
jgi:hypothetical protein